MNTTTFAPPAGVTARLAPQHIEALVAWARRAGLAVWRSLEAYGRARALRELAHLHDRWEISDPQQADQLRAATAFLVAEGSRRN